METISKEEAEAHIIPAEVHADVLPREYLTEDPKKEVKDSFGEEKLNESANIVNKCLV